MKLIENKRDFHLRGTQEEGESKGLPPSKRHKESAQEQRKRKPHEKKERATKSEPL